jgi:pyruvate formate-lyase/glycerol dehydratase family glycyl radical enzyme
LSDSLPVNAANELTRGQRLWLKLLDSRDTRVSLWRARLLTESWKETEGLPQPLRRAKAFAKIVTEIPVFIDEEQLIVGDFGAWLSAPEWHPEHNVTWERREFNAGRMPYGLNDEEIAEFQELLEYWSTRNFRDSFMGTLGEAALNRLDEVAEEGTCVYSMYVESNTDKGWNSPDHEKAIKKGFLGIIAEIDEEIEKTPVHDHASLHKRNLLEAVKIELNAGIEYGKRYSALAAELAAKAKGQRKAELQKIADMCSHVPANPARSFHEAVQMMWFVHVLGYFDTFCNGMGIGRVDQYFYPYYKKDIDSGRLTREEAITILECLRVKFNAMREFIVVYSHSAGGGEVQFHNCTLGGQTADGKDATNELSFLWLEAAFRVRSPHPTLSVRWHDKISPEFTMKAAELTRLGLGFPAWFGDDATIPYLMGPNMGATLEEARDYQLSGCVVHTIPHKTPPTWPIQPNMGKLMELTLFSGFDPTTGRQVGDKTARFEDMQDWEELYAAYCEHLRFYIKESAYYLNRMRLHRSEQVPQVLRTAFFDDCIKRGMDPLGGGCRYQGSSMYVLPIGLIDVVDSLAAIKQLVFEKKKLSKEKLIEALAANFEGYEDIRQMLLDAPKFGNDDDYVDIIASRLYTDCVKICSETESCFGAHYVCAPHSLRFHSLFGRKVGALPSGRLAGYSLADGAVSPCQGMDTKGPTATINSAGKVDQVPIFGVLFNMKFHPSSLSTAEDLQKFLTMIRTYFHDYGGKHMQFNIVSKETLLEARAHPEEHKGLVVRVAGYSALWVELERTIQDEIITRAEKSW